MRLPTFKLIQADVKEGLKQIPDNSVDVICSSPPYWAQRNYGVAGQIGHESTSQEFVDTMVDIFYNHCYRVLKPHGLIFLNLGDSYNGSGGQGTQDGLPKVREHKEAWGETKNSSKAGVLTKNDDLYKPRDLTNIPHRVYEGLRQAGYYWRSTVIWSKCLSGGTWLYAKGQKGDFCLMVRELERYPKGSIKLWNGEKWTKVLNTYKVKRHGTELELVLRSGERISCTPEHRFPTNRGLLESSQIVVGDIIDSTNIPEPDNPKDSIHIGIDAAWLAGLYLAEGSMSEEVIQISGNKKEELRWETLVHIVESYGGTITRTITGNAMNIRIYGKVINSIIKELVSGKTAKDKHLSPSCWEYSNEFLQSFLNGYLSGDGHWEEKNKRWRIGFTRNYNLERDLRILSARLGFELTLKPSIVFSFGKEWKAFKGEIRFENSGHRNKKIRSEVVEIRKARCREVWDIEVEDEPHLFCLSSGILTHNSNGMPESVKGVRWERHRIKIAPAKITYGQYSGYDEKEHKHKLAIAGHPDRQPEWKDCPGCKTCSPNNGYVLRWGSGRPTNKYECIGILTKQDYYWDTEAVRTQYAESSISRRDYALGSFGGTEDKCVSCNGLGIEYTDVSMDNDEWAEYVLSHPCPICHGTGKSSNGNRMSKTVDGTELDFAYTGANLGNVWEMPTAMFSEKHFATFPEQLPEICIKAGSSEFGCCSQCGRPYARILERVVNDYRTERYADGSGYDDRRKPTDIFAQATSSTIKTIGWKATCGCNAQHTPDENGHCTKCHIFREFFPMAGACHVPSVVLDPFSGAGTTGLVANRLGRDYLGIDLNPEYIEIAQQRIVGDAPLFYAMRSE